MRYFHRAHCSPERVLAKAGEFFSSRGFAIQQTATDVARYTGPLGTVDLRVAMEGGHYTRVEIGTPEVGESDLDKRVKRFLSELHRVEEPAYPVRGAY